MSDKIKVNTTRLNSDAERIKSCITKMRSGMENMKTQVVQLDAMWDGPSSEAFKAQFHGDMQALDAILSNLNGIYNYEKRAKGKYEKCEKQVRDIVSGIKV